MNEKLITTPGIRVLALIGVAAALLLAGCESEQRIVASETSEACPLCTRETRVHPITGLEYTTMICPSCETIVNVDPMLVDDLERFTGPNVGQTVTVCGGCGIILEECEHCRTKAAAAL